MKKYNLSNIMKRAWALVKKAGMTISSGLKKAWKEAKEIKIESVFAKVNDSTVEMFYGDYKKYVSMYKTKTYYNKDTKRIQFTLDKTICDWIRLSRKYIALTVRANRKGDARQSDFNKQANVYVGYVAKHVTNGDIEKAIELIKVMK